MKKIVLLMMFTVSMMFAETMCQVKICNKLERFTIDPFSMIKDKLGETCFDTFVPKSQAYVGNRLSSESRWYQGSFNPTKKSVTKIKQVYSCNKG